MPQKHGLHRWHPRLVQLIKMLVVKAQRKCPPYESDAGGEYCPECVASDIADPWNMQYNAEQKIVPSEIDDSEHYAG